MKELEARLGAERSTIWRWYKAGRFPQPHYIAERRVWWLHEVEEWERAQMARQPHERRSNLKHARAVVASPPAP